MKKTILLIHGWDYELYTNQTNQKNAWEEYSYFIESLKKDYQVYMINLPGFCHQEEPKQVYDVEDFAQYVNEYIKKNNLKIDTVIGYSFGGAIAVVLKKLFFPTIKLFLVAPAIVRNNSKSKAFVKTPQLLKPLRNYVRDFYVINIVKNNEMKYGSKFLRNTYQIIVRRDLSKELNSLNYQDITIVVGKKDTAINLDLLKNNLDNNHQANLYLIENADHDNIIIDYVDEVIKILKKCK